MSLSLRAFAKINLSLRIGAKRPDGYHDVQTILQAIDLSDRLTFQATRGPFEIVCAAPGVPLGRTNLVWRAAEALWNAAGREGEPRGARVRLEKRIPMQAGLGGGSADAAAALIGLRKIWKLSLPDGELLTLAARLGADVPYFMVGGTALGLGRGDQIYPLADLPRWWVVLALPPFGVATADAYAWLDARREAGPVTPEPRRLPGTWLDRLGPGVPLVPLANDLEPAVAARHPEIGAYIQRLARAGAVMAAMSGSGSAVFGVFRTSARARAAVKMLGKAGIQAKAARFLERP